MTLRLSRAILPTTVTTWFSSTVTFSIVVVNAKGNRYASGRPCIQSRTRAFTVRKPEVHGVRQLLSSLWMLCDQFRRVSFSRRSKYPSYSSSLQSNPSARPLSARSTSAFAAIVLMRVCLSCRIVTAETKYPCDPDYCTLPVLNCSSILLRLKEPGV